jgi:uncharacterized protein involved in type VI secretion and phage assembly
MQMQLDKLEKAVANLSREMTRRFYGKYRGFVKDNADPENRGRLKVVIPKVLGDEVTIWASPCVPYGGDANQGFLFIPENEAAVWIEFERGDPDYPIWVGTTWSKPGGESEVPVPNSADGAEEGAVQDPPTRKIIKTLKGHTLQFEDADGDEMVTLVDAVNSHVITLNGDGITVVDGTNGNSITMDQSGVMIEDKNGNQVIMGSSGIQVGSSSASEPFVLGTQFTTEVTNFLTSLSTHTHVGNMGAPTSPPTAPMMLNVPVSTKHKVE